MSHELQEISAIRGRVEKLEADNELLKSVAGPDIKAELEARKKKAADAEALKNFELSDAEKLQIIESRKSSSAPQE